MVELALVSFVIWLLLAGVLELGRAFSAQQILQHAAASLARELSQQPLPHDATFDQAIRSVFDDRFLVIDSNLLARCGLADFDEPGHAADLARLFEERLPPGNALLRPLMIRDRLGGIEMLRYPGAVLARTDGGVDATSDCAAGSRYTVGIPRIDEAAATIDWQKVVEASPGPDAAIGLREGFSLGEGGWAGLRVNYPFQSVGLLAAQASGPIDPATGRARQRFVDADQVYADQGLERLAAAIIDFDGTDAPAGIAAYAGRRGLGRLFAGGDGNGAGRAIRPYRRLLSATAGFRREIYLPSLSSGGAS